MYETINASERELQYIRLEETRRIMPFRDAPDFMELLKDEDLFTYIRNKPDLQLKNLVRSVIDKIIVDNNGEIKEIIFKTPFYINDEERSINYAK